MRQKTDHRYVLRCLSAQGTAPELADEIQTLHEQNLAIAKQATVTQAKSLVESELAKLPSYLEITLDDDQLIELVSELF